MSVEAGTACIRAVSDLSYMVWAARIYLPDMVAGDKDHFPPFHDASRYKDSEKVLMIEVSPQKRSFGRYRYAYDEALAA